MSPARTKVLAAGAGERAAVLVEEVGERAAEGAPNDAIGQQWRNEAIEAEWEKIRQVMEDAYAIDRARECWHSEESE